MIRAKQWGATILHLQMIRFVLFFIAFSEGLKLMPENISKYFIELIVIIALIQLNSNIALIQSQNFSIDHSLAGQQSHY